MSGDVCEVVLRTGEGCHTGFMLRSSERGALVELPSVAEGDLFSVSFDESVHGCVGLEATGRRVGVPGATETQIGIKWHYVISRVGLAPIKELFLQHFGADFPPLDDERVKHMGGGYWSVNMDSVHPDYGVEPPTQISLDFFSEVVQSCSKENGTLYPKCSVGYSIGMIAHRGRALRITATSVIVHTNGVLPPLGALVCLQFRVSNLANLPVVIFRGMVKNRTSKGSRKGQMSTFEVRIRDIYDMDESGAMVSFLKGLEVAE